MSVSVYKYFQLRYFFLPDFYIYLRTHMDHGMADCL